MANLPAPLDGITGNVMDLEATGHFKIIKAELGRTRQFQDPALIWTIRVLRPITCRHALILFRRVGDARFFRVEKDHRWRKQIYAARLYNPPWIDSGAANGQRLYRDEQFQIWVPMEHSKADLLRHDEANLVVFSHLDRIRARKRERWQFDAYESVGEEDQR
jgi:hypothetical protein